MDIGWISSETWALVCLFITMHLRYCDINDYIIKVSYATRWGHTSGAHRYPEDLNNISGEDFHVFPDSRASAHCTCESLVRGFEHFLCYLFIWKIVLNTVFEKCLYFKLPCSWQICITSVHCKFFIGFRLLHFRCLLQTKLNHIYLSRNLQWKEHIALLSSF